MIVVDRGFTLQQPHASALVAGVKDAENRPLATARLFGTLLGVEYLELAPGRVVAIHAGAKLYPGANGAPAELARVARIWPAMPEHLPMRALIGAVEFGAIVSREAAERWATAPGAVSEWALRRRAVCQSVDASRWTSGPWVLVPRRVWALPVPLPVEKGMLGLWGLSRTDAAIVTDHVNREPGRIVVDAWPSVA